MNMMETLQFQQFSEIRAGGPGSGRHKGLEKMVKALGLPGGSGARRDYEGNYEWNKRGGYFNKMGDINDKAKALGFTESKNTDNMDQMGNVSRGKALSHPDGYTLQTHQNYGETKDRNYHYIKLSVGSKKGS